eukprot:11645484-Alexandrium_andersonii.AAC.1
MGLLETASTVSPKLLPPPKSELKRARRLRGWPPPQAHPAQPLLSPRRLQGPARLLGGARPLRGTAESE